MSVSTASVASASAQGLGTLGQLARTPEDLKRLQHEAFKTFGEGGASSLDEAAKQVFALESAGVLNQRALFSQLAATGLVPDVATLARSTATLQTAIGEGETGSVRDIISKGFAASAVSPASVDALLESAARGGGSARALGVSDEELLAATAVLAKSTGTAEQGGTQIAALLQNLDKQGTFQGSTLADSLRQIQGRNLSGEQLFKFLGDQEAVGGFRTLSGNLGVFEQTTKSVQDAQSQDEVGRRVGLALSDPVLASALAETKSKNQLELVERRLGQFTNQANALENDLKKQFRIEQSTGVAGSVLKEFGALTAIEKARKFLPDQVFVQKFGGLGTEDVRRDLNIANRDSSGVATGNRNNGPVKVEVTNNGGMRAVRPGGASAALSFNNGN